MNFKKCPVTARLSSVLMCTILVAFLVAKASAEPATYVYYGYVPMSTSMWPTWADLINGTRGEFDIPPNCGLLEIVGTADSTAIEVWDIIGRTKLTSATVDRLEKLRYPVALGTFFKVVSNNPISAALFGGSQWAGEYYGYYRGGTSKFYPSVDGAFVGKEFILTHFSATDQYSLARRGSNFFLYALEDCDYVIHNGGKILKEGHLKQHEYLDLFMIFEMPNVTTPYGAGYSTISHVKTTGHCILSAWGSCSFTYLPSLEGGFVGHLFVGSVYASVSEAGTSASFIVIPYEPGKVIVYDDKLNVLAEHTFTSQDVDDGAFWFHSVKETRPGIIFKSEGLTSVMTGDTRGQISPEYMGDDISFLGARPNQELRFFAPTSAVLLAPTELDVTVDGEAHHMKADDYLLIGYGVHTVKTTSTVIVQVLGAANGWLNWGSYLISPQDVEKTFTIPAGFAEKRFALSIDMIVGITIVIIVVGIVTWKKVLPRFKKSQATSQRQAYHTHVV